MMGIGWGVSGLEIVVYLIHSAIFTIPTVIVFGAFLIMGTIISRAL
jgi:hypothetical protein